MRFFKNLIRINDLFFISSKLKTINQNFELFFNTKSQFFEVHDISKEQSFVISFQKYPNENLIFKLQKTKTSNKNIFKEIEQNNKIVEQKKQKILKNEISDCFHEICNFSEKCTNNISKKQIKKIIEKG